MQSLEWKQLALPAGLALAAGLLTVGLMALVGHSLVAFALVGLLLSTNLFTLWMLYRSQKLVSEELWRQNVNRIPRVSGNPELSQPTPDNPEFRGDASSVWALHSRVDSSVEEKSQFSLGTLEFEPPEPIASARSPSTTRKAFSRHNEQVNGQTSPQQPAMPTLVPERASQPKVTAKETSSAGSPHARTARTASQSKRVETSGTALIEPGTMSAMESALTKVRRQPSSRVAKSRSHLDRLTQLFKLIKQTNEPIQSWSGGQLEHVASRFTVQVVTDEDLIASLLPERVWHPDLRFHGSYEDYAAMFHAMLAIANPMISVNSLQSMRDVTSGMCMLGFEYEGGTVYWNFRQTERLIAKDFIRQAFDWISSHIGGRFAELTETLESGELRYLYISSQLDKQLQAKSI